MTEREIVEKLAALDEPLAESGSGDLNCALCGALRPYDEHEPDCPWAAAKKLVGNAPPK